MVIENLSVMASIFMTLIAILCDVASLNNIIKEKHKNAVLQELQFRPIKN